VASVAVASLAPPLLLGWLSWRLERRALRDDLEARARSAAAVVDALLSQTEGFLARAGNDWQGGCAPGTLEKLRSAVDLGLSVRDLALLGVSLVPECRVGAALPPIPDAVRQVLPRDGRALWDGAAGGTLFFVLRLPRGAGLASLEASRLARAVAPLAAGQRLVTEVVGANGAVLRVPGARETAVRRPPAVLRLAGRLVGVRVEEATALCSGGGVAVRVSSSPDAQLAAWGETLPLLLAVGLGFGAGAAALVLLAGSPGAALIRQLRGAVRRGELEVRYLPVVDVRSGRCVGAEALLRWRHAREGLLSPDLFIALAEETGLILPITEWLMRRVARDLPDGLPDPDSFHVSINLAGPHLRDSRTVGAILRAFEGSSLRPSSLVFEVTEREFIEDEGGTARNVLEALQGWGAKIALDDFGTGFSNIASLRRFRLDHLKIDKSFVEGIGSGSVAETVIDAVVDLGQRLDLTLVAEGVERQEQVDYLLARGVHLFQGFHFSLPLALPGLVRFVEDRAAAAEEERAAAEGPAAPPAAAAPV
jgi:EAL domain-containing protein (putative c-di-GMP-specific phosphodiesterase class I)